MGIGIDIGAGGNKLAHPQHQILAYDIRLDSGPDVCGDATILPFKSGAFDIIHSSHVLEHFPRRLWKAVFAEWCRVLKVGGEMWLNLPNIMWAVERLVVDKVFDEHTLDVLYGGQDHEFDYHYNGLTPERMAVEFEKNRLEVIHFQLQSYNMHFGCRKTS